MYSRVIAAGRDAAPGARKCCCASSGVSRMRSSPRSLSASMDNTPYCCQSSGLAVSVVEIPRPASVLPLQTERDGLGQRVHAGDAERAEEERLGEHAPGQRPGQLDRVLGRKALIPADVFRYGLVDADGCLLRHEHEDHDIQNGHRHREAENKALVAGKPVFMFSHHGPSQKVYKFFRSDALKWLQNSV